jgi:hypothetical protein
VDDVKPRRVRDISWLMEDGRAVDAALRKAVREALWRHKRLGVPIVIWKDGKVVRVPPSRIPVGGRRSAGKGRRRSRR